MKKYGAGHLMLLVIAAVLLGWGASGCGPEEGDKKPKSACSTDAGGNHDCPLRTGVQPSH